MSEENLSCMITEYWILNKVMGFWHIQSTCGYYTTVYNLGFCPAYTRMHAGWPLCKDSHLQLNISFLTNFSTYHLTLWLMDSHRALVSIVMQKLFSITHFLFLY